MALRERVPYSFARVEQGLLEDAEEPLCPLVLAAVKKFLKVETTDEDDTIDDIMSAACEQVEKSTGRTIFGRQLTARWDVIPGGNGPWWGGVREGPETLLGSQARELEIPRPPTVEVLEIATYDLDNTRTVYDDSNYIVDSGDDDQPARVILNVGSIWPTNLRPRIALEAVYAAGYASLEADVVVSSLPSGLKMALYKVVAWGWANRGDSIPEDMLTASGMMPTIKDYRIVAK